MIAFAEIYRGNYFLKCKGQAQSKEVLINNDFKMEPD